MGELANCPQCGALFVSGPQAVCRDCFKKEEEAFEIVYTFIRKRENRSATIPEVVEATGVKEDLIIKFIKSKRIRSTHFLNMNYGCEKCGGPITEGNLCDKCTSHFRKELDRVNELASKQKEREEQQTNTYYSVNKGK
ncbi:TIGR03826 family flagellar region protein [Thalassobacillus hwangdonensis]|uniref:TIGR03826 family flagellar region protein n=1 Tax=Thalassobacillus hwangdonensis TaxID=546108 RepID=A0ABW3L592_9BACI